MDTRPFHSSPPKPTPRGYNLYSTKPVPLVNSRKRQLRENMEGYFLGPMNPSEFMRAFMPINSSGVSRPPGEIDFSLVYAQGSEKSMYDPFVSNFLLIQRQRSY